MSTLIVINSHVIGIRTFPFRTLFSDCIPRGIFLLLLMIQYSIFFFIFQRSLSDFSFAGIPFERVSAYRLQIAERHSRHLCVDSFRIRRRFLYKNHSIQFDGCSRNPLHVASRQGRLWYRLSPLSLSSSLNVLALSHRINPR